MSKAAIYRTEAGDISAPVKGPEEQAIVLAYLQQPTKVGEHGGVTTMDSKLFSKLEETLPGIVATTATGRHLVPWPNIKVCTYAK